jgi:hypothetical protein
VRLALKVVKQNDGDFVDVLLLYSLAILLDGLRKTTETARKVACLSIEM